MTDPADVTDASADWPGRSLGLPRSGSGSMARVGRRVAALALDWAACSLLSAAFFGYGSWATLAAFVVQQLLLVPTLGGGFGHVLLGLRVHRMQDRTTPPAPLAAVVRTVLLALVVPALVPDVHGRGLHDRAAGTVLLRR